MSLDASILVYSLIEGEYSPLVKKLQEKETDWRTTALCLHEEWEVVAELISLDMI